MNCLLMKPTPRLQFKEPISLLLITLALLIFADSVYGQSTDASAPTPLTSNLADGRVEPLDIGDSRLTRHYYAFSAGPGDLVINVESSNLNGDVDLFAAVGLRPLVKVSVFASSFASEANRVSKSVFLRRQETIVLRVEGRAAGDQAARYQVSFEGPFIAARAPAPDDAKSGASLAAAATPNARAGTRRVNSIGARIEEPAPAPAETAPETPTAAPRNESATASTTTAETPNASPAATRTPPPRRTNLPRARTSAARRRLPPAATPRGVPEKTTEKPETGMGDPPPPVSAPPRPVVASAAKAPTAAAAVGVRLVIEMRGGETLERAMSDVRRLTVERGVLIIVGGDGRTERRPMSDVLRVAIE